MNSRFVLALGISAGMALLVSGIFYQVAVRNRPSQSEPVELREVVIGIETPADVEVASGLSDGELVVIGSQSLLEPGELVTPRETQPADAAQEDL